MYILSNLDITGLYNKVNQMCNTLNLDFQSLSINFFETFFPFVIYGNMPLKFKLGEFI